MCFGKKNQKIMFQFSLVQETRERVVSLGKMGEDSNTHTSRRLGFQEHFPLIKGLSNKKWVESTVYKEPMDLGSYTKYIGPISLEDQIKREDKQSTSIYVIWKAVLNSFENIRICLAWTVDEGDRVRLGQDPQLGSDHGHILPQPLTIVPRDKGISKLAHIANPTNTTLWSQGWRAAKDLGLEEGFHETRGTFLNALSKGQICLTEGEDKLVQGTSPFGTYTPNLDYISLNTDRALTDTKWWWKAVWKSKCPSKAKISMWDLMEKKIPTWDILH